MTDIQPPPEDDPVIPLLRLLAPAVVRVERNRETREPEVLVRAGPGRDDGFLRFPLQHALDEGWVEVADEPLPGL